MSLLRQTPADPEALARGTSLRRAGRSAPSLEEAAFASGAALATLQGAMTRPGVPGAVLRDRLALRAAQACLRLAGRVETVAALRDVVHLLRPGDLPGPAGAVCLPWQRAVARPVSVRALHRALPHLGADRIAEWLDAGGAGGPVARAASVLQAVLADRPRDEAAALILANAALALAFGWTHLVPLLGAGLTPRALRRTDAELRRVCHGAVAAMAGDAAAMAADLARRAAHLRGVAPGLRAKGAGAAVELFLTQDALAPGALRGLLSDRAARRLCDRLVGLGAVQEMTGRDTFRLYGI
jgi:hypothetical protein